MTHDEEPTQVERVDQLPLKDRRTGRTAAQSRIGHQASWVDQQVRVAMAKGEFDDLPGAGKPIEGLGRDHDPDWWIKKLVERENITVLPPSLQLRKDDAELGARLDALFTDAEVRREVEEFNARIIRARYSPQDGQPPLITMPREVEETVLAWRERRDDRAAAARARRDELEATAPRRRWWQRSVR
ncbi:hypothetical protein NPS01_33650 [Nocardioides psychrotolerans]|uniref:DnaJ homologue subfamily C member 28 conserved domain-containing protein n=1 Tax=Nocardioides psychrotolerans TaxID=1005945 RepID=A0A1I3PM37_9ACTN|nr:DUF1992 domain-containing protein [Nocardioides psychrotolerans]GEP39702.1 hypothetical protein NPS01_33650 [Nocardioides psychrotolerans]SFJ22410.1 protein of unknown function [Nocardioides psychrotolerans]